jgi:inward rectifier potassium channel
MIKKLSDPGLGEKFYQNKSRMVNKDGSFNSKRTGMKRHLYHYLISISGLKISMIILGTYLAANIGFAAIYYLIGIDKLGGQHFDNDFITGFLFSMQAFTTVGFGAIYPFDYMTGLVSGLEALLGLLFFAFATGIVYGRFSKPTAFIKFSDKAIIAPYKEGKAFMFRIVNARPSTLIEMSVRIILALKKEEGDSSIRTYFNLDIETSSVVFFPMPWTLVHDINENSPLYKLSVDDIKKLDAEFLIHVKGFDETYAQNTNTIFSYKYDEIEWGRKFKLNFNLNAVGQVEYDINKIGETILADLPN